jgi:hypothetical protein
MTLQETTGLLSRFYCFIEDLFSDSSSKDDHDLANHDSRILLIDLAIYLFFYLYLFIFINNPYPQYFLQYLCFLLNFYLTVKFNFFCFLSILFTSKIIFNKKKKKKIFFQSCFISLII